MIIFVSKMSFVKNRTKYLLYENEEPPSKKIISDGDLLIKKLVEKQQNTKVDLKQQLQNPKVFERSTDFVPITKNLRGKCALTEFEEAAVRLQEQELFKSAGLSEKDIQMVLDFRDGTLYDKHRNFEQSLLKDRIEKLIATIEDFRNKNQPCNSNKSIQDRHKTEFALSIKPESTETKLLKFALQNEETKKTHFPHPMDNIKEMEQNLFGSLSEEFRSPIKIQKKLRKLAQKVNNMDGNSSAESVKPQSLKPNENVSVSYVPESKWDKRDTTANNNEDVKVPKIFSCKPQNYYTIRDGVIVKLSENEIKGTNLEVSKRKLSVEEIKKLPKFANYEIGVPSKTLYAKNLPRNINELDLKTIFSKYNKNECLQFKVMSARMRGQAFITFPEVNLASTALEDVNGIVIGDKPIVLEFGRQNKLKKNYI